MTFLKSALAIAALTGAPLMAAELSFSPAIANDLAPLVDEQAATLDHAPEACKEVNLSVEQKAAVRASLIETKRASIVAESDLKLATLDYIAALTDASAAIQAASDIGAKVVAGHTKIVDLWMTFKTKLFFGILKVEQREPALKCLMAMKAAHGAKHP